MVPCWVAQASGDQDTIPNVVNNHSDHIFSLSDLRMIFCLESIGRELGYITDVKTALEAVDGIFFLRDFSKITKNIYK